MTPEDQTPTHKKFGSKLDEVLARADLQTDVFSFEYMKELLQAFTGLVDCPDAKDLIIEGIDESVGQLESLAESNPAIAGDLAKAMETMTIMMVLAANEIGCRAIENERTKMKNLVQIKAGKAEDEAQLVAEGLWADDVDKELRITDAAKDTADELRRTGFGTWGVKTVKGWIAKVAPDYARKPGRTKKK